MPAATMGLKPAKPYVIAKEALDELLGPGLVDETEKLKRGEAKEKRVTAKTIKPEVQGKADLNKISAEIKKIFYDGNRFNDTESDLGRHVLLLVNVAAEASDYLFEKNGVGGLDKWAEISEQAAINAKIAGRSAGIKVGFEDQMARYSNIDEKVKTAANLFVICRDLAVGACMEFIDYRVGRHAGDEKGEMYERQYGKALKTILKIVDSQDRKKRI